MNPESSAQQVTLQDYLRVLRSHRGIIALSTLVVLAATLAASFLQTPVYQATAEILLQPRSNESLFDTQTGQRRDPNRAIQTEIQVLTSQPVRDAVTQALGLTPPISVSPVAETDVIRVRSQRTSPEQAAAVANAYARSYIDFRRKQAVDDVLSAAQEIQRKITALQPQIDAIQGQQPTKENPNPATPPAKEALVQQQALFKQKLDELQVDAALRTGGAQLVTPASASTSPVKPTPVRNAAVALVAGVILGVCLAFLAEYLDDSIRVKDDLERAGGLATLGLIPQVADWKDRHRPLIVSVDQPKSPAAEAYRALRTSIQFMRLDRPLRVIQITSPAASEGKTTTVVNLATTLAAAGERVVVVDCDLRRPRVHEFFGLDNTIGFTSVLLGDLPLSASLQPIAGQEGLTVLASGPIPPNPAELLAGFRTREVLDALKSNSNIVLLDCPPVLPVTDAAVLGSRVDATVLVATAGRTSRKAVQRACETLRQVQGPLIGAVLNGVTGDDGYGYGYRYSYGYTDAGSQDNGRKGQPVSNRT